MSARPKPLNRNRLPKWARDYGTDGESPVVVFTRMARRVPDLDRALANRRAEDEKVAQTIGAHRLARDSAERAARLADSRREKAEKDLTAARDELGAAKEAIVKMGQSGEAALARTLARHRLDLHAVAGAAGVVGVLVGAVATALVLAAL